MSEPGAATRQRILDAVRARPGLPLSELRGHAGIGWSALYHHLRRLEGEGAVRRVAVAGRRLVVPADSEDGLDVAYAQGILRGRTARRIARIIADGAADDVAGIAALTGMQPRGVSHHVQRLVRAQLATSAARHRYVRLRPTSLLLQVLSEIGEA